MYSLWENININISNYCLLQIQREAIHYSSFYLNSLNQICIHQREAIHYSSFNLNSLNQMCTHQREAIHYSSF
jgi:hypothetical protein